jgi:hypothetical protein
MKNKALLSVNADNNVINPTGSSCTQLVKNPDNLIDPVAGVLSANA